MQLICIYFYSQCLKFYHEVSCILLSLLKDLYLPFSIYSLGLVTKCYLDLSYKLVPILDFSFFVQLIKLFLGINTSYTPLRQARIAVILLSISITLLLLRNNLIPLHQSSNFVLFLSNHSGSRTIFFSNSAYPLFCPTSAVNILSSFSIVYSKASSVICRDSSYSDNASISFS